MPRQTDQHLLRQIPSVDQLLSHPTVADLLPDHPRALVVQGVRAIVDRCRESLLGRSQSNQPAAVQLDALADEVCLAVAAMARRSLRGVVNATGVVLHTGLGRAPLSGQAIEALIDVGAGYSNLELDLDSGRRGRRTDHVAELLCQLTGAQAAVVVNNNAAATLLALNAVAAGREVIVSRGQLIEIGGSYRLPDVMAASGAILREVGTTNRTRADDYAKAINERTAAIMQVHTSNYKVVGFVEQAATAELAELARRHDLVLIDDIGSGAMFDVSALDLPAEPWFGGSLDAGADLVLGSGDKLLGGPQAGIIVGRTELIDSIVANPLMRTYRVGKLTLAALEATLMLYRDRQEALKSVPTLALLGQSHEQLQQRARLLADRLRQVLPEAQVSADDDLAYVGGGALPVCQLPTAVVRLRFKDGRNLTDTARALRLGRPAVVARIAEDALVVDLRSLLPGQEDLVVQACEQLNGADSAAAPPGDQRSPT